MAVLNVSPTRNELLNLKRKHKRALGGYKLLKQKRDGLMKKFLDIIREAKTLRKKMEDVLQEGVKRFMFAGAVMHPLEIAEALMLPRKKISLTVQTKNVMGVKIPELKLEEEGSVHAYGYFTTSAQLDRSLEIFSEALAMMIQLAEIEKGAEMLAEEIEKTRRRVNALEYVMIPNIEETLKYISMKLAEMDRSSRTTVMKVKEMLEAQEEI